MAVDIITKEDLKEFKIELLQDLQEILNSTSVISDNITHLSATGEEVAAASTEGMRVTAETVESMKKCKEILNNIYLLAEDLKSSVQE
jgi:methyl-accepting chemotaxis protein